MDKLDHLGWVVSSSFAIGDVRFAVRSTSHAFGEWLSDTLGAYEVDDVEDYLYSVVVPEPPADGKAKEFCILYKGSTAIVRTLDPVTLGRGVLAELEGLGFHERDDAVYVMASLVDVAGAPTLVPSSLAPGLAKLGRRAAKLGVEIPGELTVAIDLETASIVPVRHTLDVPGDALERLADRVSVGGTGRAAVRRGSRGHPGVPGTHRRRPRGSAAAARGRDTHSRTSRVDAQPAEGRRHAVWTRSGVSSNARPRTNRRGRTRLS